MPSVPLQIRPYQTLINERSLAAWDEGLESVLVISPTGSGKTVMGLMLAKAMKESDAELGVVWVALRRTLLKQVVDENERIGVKNLVPLSAFDKDVEGKVSVFERVLLVFDEAHHSPADTLVSLWDNCSPVFTLGLTATPMRCDDMRLCFQRILQEAGYHRLIADGYLSQYALHLLSRYAPETVADAYLADSAKWGRSAMFFLALDDCRDCCERLTAGGVRASVVTGASDRETQLEDFEAGKIDVLLSSGVLTEGWDCPTLETVFVRDASKGPTIQMCGRVLRLDPANPIKNIVQSKNTPWNFGRTALPKVSYSETHTGEWLSLTPDTKLLLDAMKAADARMNAQLLTLDQHSAKSLAKLHSRSARAKRARRLDSAAKGEDNDGDGNDSTSGPETTAIARTEAA